MVNQRVEFVGGEYEAMAEELITLSRRHPCLMEFLDAIARIGTGQEDAIVWMKRGRDSCCDLTHKVVVGIKRRDMREVASA